MPAQGMLPRRTTGSHPQVTSPAAPPAPGAPGARRPTGPHPQVSLPDLSYSEGSASGPGLYSTAAAYRPQSQPPGPGAPPAGRTATPPSTPAVSSQSSRGPGQHRPSGRFPAASGDPADAVTEPAVQTMSVAAAEALLREREREREAAALRRATPVPKPKDEAEETSGAKPPETKPPDGGTS